jgi:hypothetical protein
MKRIEGELIRTFPLNGHDFTSEAELRKHGNELVVWFLDTDIHGKPEKTWKIFIAGPECERYRK